MNVFMFPLAFKSQMQTLLGEEYAAFENAYGVNAPVSIRVNPDKFSEQVSHPGIGWSRYGYYLDERPVFTLDPWFHAGLYYVQEASSMFLEQVFVQQVDPEEALNVLDLCAAPGGKSTHILSLLNKKSLLVSNEVIKSRAYILKENLQKWGRSNVVVTNSDPERFTSLKGLFDIIVVDAPCSGEGLFRRDEEAMKEWSPENVQLCVSRQRRILEAAWETLKPGGLMVYSTCTFNTHEDEENLDWLIRERGGDTVKIQLKDEWNIREVYSREGGVGYKFFPHQVKGEGFFMTVVRKTEGEEGNINFRRQKTPFAALPKEAAGETESWMKENTLKKVLFGEQVLAFPEEKEDIIIALTSQLHIISCGLEMAVLKKKNIVPAPALALSADLNTAYFPVVEVEYQEALRYLAKESFDLELPQGDWILVCFQGIPLGWLKKINQRFNNYYPVEWRIRMTIGRNAEHLPVLL